MTITIFFDHSNTTTTTPGWAYRDDRPGSPLGSVPIDDAKVAEALHELVTFGVIDADQRAAIDRSVTETVGAAREDVTLAGIGPLYP